MRSNQSVFENTHNFLQFFGAKIKSLLPSVYCHPVCMLSLAHVISSSYVRGLELCVCVCDSTSVIYLLGIDGQCGYFFGLNVHAQCGCTHAQRARQALVHQTCCDRMLCDNFCASVRALHPRMRVLCARTRYVLFRRMEAFIHTDTAHSRKHVHTHFSVERYFFLGCFVCAVCVCVFFSCIFVRACLLVCYGRLCVCLCLRVRW